MKVRIRTIVAAGALAGLLVGGAPAAWADEYDPQESGHPLRVAAYVLHPIGVIVDTLIFRPAHWLVQHEPLTTLFGHEGF